MELSKSLIIAESVFFMVLEFGFMIFIMWLEGLDMFFNLAAIGLSIVYSIVVYFACRTTSGDDILGRANKRRIGVGLVFAFFLSFAPWRAVNLVAMFAALDVLITLLPGKVILYGKELWKENKIIYICILAASLGLFLINVFHVPPQTLYTGLTIISGNLFLVIFVIFILIVLLGILGIKLKN